MHIPRPIQLMLDFDGSITTKDTLHLIARAGRLRGKLLESRTTNEQRLSWSQIVDAYLTDFKAHSESYKPRKHERKSLREELEWLDSLRPVEIASARRAFNSGIFDSITTKDITKVAEEAFASNEICARPGLGDLLQRIQIHNLEVANTEHDTGVAPQILSVNWSRTFVLAVLRQIIGASPSQVEVRAKNEERECPIAVYANELPSISDELSKLRTGHPLRSDTGLAMELRTSGDKLMQMEQLVEKASSHGSHKSRRQQRPITIYVGDSATDMGCLTAADIGVCIRDEPMGGSQAELAELCERIGIPVDHISLLSNGTYSKPRISHANSSRLWWARDFAEIDERLMSMNE